MKNIPKRADGGVYALQSVTQLTDGSIAESKQKVDKTSHRSLHDYLNFRTRFTEACRNADSAHTHMSIFMVAIDNWEVLSKYFGESNLETCQRLALDIMVARATAFFGRSDSVYFGEYVPGRFLVLLDGVSASLARRFAEDLKHAISAGKSMFGHIPVRLTASIGIVYKPGYVGTQDRLILNLDQICEHTLRRGGNKVAFGYIDTSVDKN